MAAYQQLVAPVASQPDRRTLELARTDPVGTERLARSYHWTKTAPSSHSRLGDSGTQGLKNQSLFLQGFKLAFSPGFLHRMRSCSGGADSNSSRPTQGGSDEQDGPSNRDPHSGDKDDTAHSNGRRQQGGSSTWTTQSAVNASNGEFSANVHSDDVGCSQFPAHSGTASLSRFIVSGQTGAEFAISHDDDWRYLLSSDFPTLSNPNVALKHAIDTPFASPKMSSTPDARSMTMMNGVACLSAMVWPTPPENGDIDGAIEETCALSSAQHGEGTTMEPTDTNEGVFEEFTLVEVESSSDASAIVGGKLSFVSSVSPQTAVPTQKGCDDKTLTELPSKSERHWTWVTASTDFAQGHPDDIAARKGKTDNDSLG
ncbi:hypothetical protein NMY22_g16735 [Coprinellus aureogranulatus]|nr:hypothetical protein NMY22_g16735 [Coprinellus aureogranulatus]